MPRRARAVVIAALLLGPFAHGDEALPIGTNELRAAAENGDPIAQFCLGHRLFHPLHKNPASDAEADKWFRLAAAQGNAQAEESVGQLYFSGRGETQDYAQAVAWFRKAAEQGNKWAQQRLAQMYREGKGVAVDLEEARRWNTLAAHSPPPTPCYPPGALAANQTREIGGETLADYPELRRAAEAGDAEAQFRLGERYYDERVRDPAKDAEAQKWLRLAAAQGNGNAEDRLGWIYYRGNGVPQDYVGAANWYRRAAAHGNLDAMTRLGTLYQQGNGVALDRAEGRRWINKANEIATRPSRMREDAWATGLLLAGLAFAASLWLLQNNKVCDWRRVAVASYVHVVGIALVLNTLNTYGLPQLLFPKCSAGAWLSTSCWNYQDPAVRQFATTLHDWQMFNLIWRFMAGIGLLADVLAIWYVGYLVQLLLRRHPRWSRSRRHSQG
jgi:TPR repeat protein